MTVDRSSHQRGPDADPSAADLFAPLDDPSTFVPDAAFRSRVTERGARLRRRRRAAIAGTSVMATLLVLLGGFGVYEQGRMRQITRVDLTDHLTDPSEASTGDGLLPTEAMTILLVGTDDAMPGEDRPPDEARADAMMLVRIDPVEHHVSVVSLPRDLWVTIPGHGPDRLATAWSVGGPAVLLDTITATFPGLEINHYLALDGNGFRDLVDQAGGVDVHVTGDLRDVASGFAASRSDSDCEHLDGGGALALARSRDLERWNGGAWTPDTNGDAGRRRRQQILGLALARSLFGGSATPGGLHGLVGTLMDHATIDSSWSEREMVGIVMWARGIDLTDELDLADLPTIAGFEGTQSVLHPVLDSSGRPTMQGAVTLGRTAGSAPGVPTEPWLHSTRPDGSACR